MHVDDYSKNSSNFFFTSLPNSGSFIHTYNL
jgi:hypothetical protein